MIDQAKTILAKIDETLFVAEQRRLRATLDALVVANNEVQGQLLMGFFYNGDYHIHSKITPNVSATSGGVKPTLHISLNDQMQAHLKDKKDVKLDRDQIRQILHKILDDCLCLEHIRDALPECLVSLVPHLASMPRRFPQEHFLLGDARVKRQFLLLLPKMEMYAVSRFLY